MKYNKYMQIRHPIKVKRSNNNVLGDDKVYLIEGNEQEDHNIIPRNLIQQTRATEYVKIKNNYRKEATKMSKNKNKKIERCSECGSALSKIYEVHSRKLCNECFLIYDGSKSIIPEIKKMEKLNKEALADVTKRKSWLKTFMKGGGNDENSN